MKYIVTGGAGFIGSHLCEALVSQGHELVISPDWAFGRMEHLAGIINHPDVTFHQVSILNFPALLDIRKDADGVFHQAALVSVPRSIDDPATTESCNHPDRDAECAAGCQ